MDDTSSIRADSGSTSRCRSRPHETVGVKAKHKEKCAFSSREDHLSRRSVGFDHNAGTSVSSSDRVDPHGSQESKRRPVTRCHTVSETVGSDGSCVQRDTFWPAVHETLAVVAQDQRVFPEGQPVPHDQGHAARLTGLRHVEETLVPVTRPRVVGSVSSCNTDDGRLPHGQSGPWSPFHVAHKLPGKAGRVSSFEAFSPRPERPSCASSHRQHIGGLLYKSSGGSAFTPSLQAGASDPSLGPGEAALTEGSLYPRAPQSGSRYPVEAVAEAWGMETPPRSGGADMEEVLHRTSGSVCDSRDFALSPLVFPHSPSSSGTGRCSTDVAKAAPVCFSPDHSAPGSCGESSLRRGLFLFSSPILAGPSMVCRPGSPTRRLSMGDFRLAGSPLSGGGHYCSPPSGVVEAQGPQLTASGLSTEVVETILQSRAPSTRKSYTAKWQLFTSWCDERKLDPVNCPVGPVLEFLQDCFATGLSPL